MTIQVFGPEATVSTLNRAFTDTSPANAIFNNQVTSAKSMGDQAFANAFAASWSGLSNADLSKKVLTNMGILPTTDTSVAALEQALTDYFAAFGSKVSGANGQVTADTRGFIVLQLASILSNSETSTGNLAVYNAAAVAWNSEVAASYTYSSNTANTTPTKTGSTGQTLNLTVNQDTITGGTGDDTITGTLMQTSSNANTNSLNSSDVIDGGAGNDTLNVTLGQNTLVSPSLRSVENVVVRFVSTDALYFTGSTGVTSVTANGSTASSSYLYDIGDIASIAIKNQVGGAVRVGGVAGSATTMALGFDTVGTKTETAVNTVNLDLGATNASKVTTANITANNAYVDINSTNNDVITTATIAATGTNTLLFTDSQSTLTKITATGDGSVDLRATPAMVAAGTPVQLSKVTTLDAAAVKGAVTAELTHQTSAITVTTGAGDDYIKVSGVNASGSSVSVGAGNDTVIVGGKLVNIGKGVNGGDGTDIINLTSSLTSQTDAKLITNFETLDFSGSAAATYDVSLNNFPTVQVDESINGALGGAVTLDKAPDTFALTLASKKTAAGSAATAFDYAPTGNTLTIVGKDYNGTTANSDAETFNLIAKLVDGNKDGVIQGGILGSAALKVGDNTPATGVESLNITATATVDGGSTSSANVTSNYVYTPNIAIAAVETITIKGDATVNFTGSTFGSNAITKVDASASTGNIITNGVYSSGTSVAYFGAAGVDTYTASGKGDSLYTAKGGDQITLAAGRDTLVYKAGSDSQITDVSKDGKVTLSAGDLGVAGTIGTSSTAAAVAAAAAGTPAAGYVGTYAVLPTATVDTIGSFQLASAASATTATDRIDLTNFAFTGSQRGLENVTAKVSSTTDLTSITGLFSSTAGNRGVAFTTLTAAGTDAYVFVDANKDGNFTAADDLVILVGGGAKITETDFNF